MLNEMNCLQNKIDEDRWNLNHNAEASNKNFTIYKNNDLVSINLW